MSRKQKTNSKFKETQEQIKIEIGKTVGEIFSSTTDDNIKELESQFIDIGDELEIEPVIVEHTLKAVDQIIKENDQSKLEKEDWMEQVPETVLESMSIAQTLTKEDRERIKNSVIEFMGSKVFEKTMAEKLLSLSKSDDGVEEENKDQDQDTVLLITQKKVVNAVDGAEAPVGKSPTKEKAVKEKGSETVDEAVKRGFTFMQKSAKEMVKMLKKSVS